MDLSIIIPIYNEEGILKSAISNLIKDMGHLSVDYEIILYENGSTDRTRAIAYELSYNKRNIWVRTVLFPNYGEALKLGIRRSLGDIIICDEIDICDTGFYAWAMRYINDEDYDMVIGSKLHKDAKDTRPYIRHIGSIVYNLLLRLLFGLKAKDTHGIKAFSRKAILPIVSQCVSDKDIFASELVIRAERAGKRIKEIPIIIKEIRKTPVSLFRRIPDVIRDLARLYYVMRIKKGVR